MNVMPTWNSWRVERAAAEVGKAKEARWIRAEAMMEDFMAGEFEGVCFSWYKLRTQKKKMGFLVTVLFKQ